MSANQRGWTDQRVEQFLGNLLRAGVTLAATTASSGASRRTCAAPWGS
jgi:hypothetical protein